MRPTRFSITTTALLMLPLATAALAQTAIVQRVAVPEADELAGQMRVLAANPLDVNALVRAGELTLDMGDATAAAAFFARAERIDPRNARIKAGLGGMLVLAERPGEALRRFAEAEALGRDPRYYAAQRGLAYDLVGEQDRAQRDYRLALKTAPDDETVRRYALSLGISGQRDAALAQIDMLLRKSDRGAWRSRAFILAMTGDTAGASRIAASMMPAGMSQGLDPFFERLPQLSAADRAFAVHFGEVRATPQRLADARMVPVLAALAPEPGRQLILASTVPTAPRDLKAERKAAKRRKGKTQLAVTTEVAPVPLPQPPTYVATADPATDIAQQPVYVAAVTPTDRRVAEVRDARNGAQGRSFSPVVTTPAMRAAQPVTLASNEPVALADNRVGALANSRQTILADRRMSPVIVTPPDRGAFTRADPLPITTAAQLPVEADNRVADAGEETTPVAPQPVTLAQPVVTPPVTVAAIPAAPVPSPAPERTLDVTPPQPVQRPPISEDSVLARIVANIVIPGSELEASRAAVAPVGSDSAGVSAAERKLAAARAVSDKKALADKKAAAEKKLADKKAADIAKADPARIWVQVAGGANEGTLPKEWAKVRDKAPAAFKGKSGWTTPLRATNRVLAGPFKTNDEARAFVNLVAKSGVSGFTFTSDAGQKITKLPVK